MIGFGSNLVDLSWYIRQKVKEGVASATASKIIMDTTAAPQLIEHINQSINFTPFDVKWVPKTAKLVVVGQVSMRRSF